MLAAEEVPAGSRKQREDLAPTEEGEGAEDDEEQGIAGELNEREDRQSFQAEGDGHRFLAADVVGDPAPERATEPVHQPVRGEGELERRQGNKEEADRDLVDLEVDRHRVELGDGHQATRSNERHHQVHQPELRRGGHLAGSEVQRGLALLHLLAARCLCPGPRQPAGGRGLEKQCRDDDDDTLDDAPVDEGVLVSCRVNHVGDGHHGERGAGAEACGRQSRREPAVVGEPLQGAADRGAVHHAGAQSGERVGGIKSG